VCEVLVLGPSQLELCFGDLGRMPRPGEELWCREMSVRPRWAALTAVAASRLGLRTALGSPLGDDFPGRYLQALLAQEAVRWIGPPSIASGMRVDFGLECGTAARVVPPPVPETIDVGGVGPRALVGRLEWLARAPFGGPRYGLAADAAGGQEPAAGDGGLRVLLATPGAAAAMTGVDDPEGAAARLHAAFGRVVIDRGRAGALALLEGERVEVPFAPAGHHPAHKQHCLFVTAYIWADLQGLPPGERLRWAILHASRGDLP
jgi:sugar/nucleoside kinase (ribokinase family)